MNEERDKVLNRFSPEFREKISTIPEYHIVYRLLLEGADEYKVIEQLVDLLHNRQLEITRLAEKQQIKYIITKEDYDRSIKGTGT